MNDVDNGHYLYTIYSNKESVVEPDLKPAAVVNHSTLEVLFFFMTPAWTVLKAFE